ncbi:uncharacterized protein LOC131198516 [Ahaetulla prasina]|uniref:uncharacterized protein LOC131198516 n=1 Tax=Ahaetulla prasina TaxID=499056 RepID=UPI00264860F4|nr:uncharacterized protein LOC131198516 [Ahaetulla prasina]
MGCGGNPSGIGLDPAKTRGTEVTGSGAKEKAGVRPYKGYSIGMVNGRGRYSGSRGPHHVRGVCTRCLRAIAHSGPCGFPRSPSGWNPHSLDLRLLLCNSRSVVNKAPLIFDLIQEGGADLMGISETWLGMEEGVPLVEMCPLGFRAFHQPRAQGRGGGVVVIINEGLDPREVTVPQIAGCESLFVKWGQGMQVGLLITYLAPCCVTAALPELLEVIAGTAVDTPRLMVMGDFNLPSAGKAATAREFMASMTALDLTQLVNGPIHIGGNTLDLFFVSGQWLNDLELGDLVIHPLSWSDHTLLRLDFQTANPHRRETELTRWFRPRRLMDPERFLTELGPFPEDLAHGLAEELVTAWERAAARALDASCLCGL